MLKQDNADSPNVTIGQSQRGGASVNLGFNTGIGNLGLTYTGANGAFGGSFDLLERQIGNVKLSSELSYNDHEGLSISGNADFGNGYGLGLENGPLLSQEKIRKG